MDLSSLIASRLCHDLASPLGAIGNGVELMRMTHPPSEEMDLLDASVQSAQARLTLYRLAFGAATPDQTVSAANIRQALEALGHARAITIDCRSPDLARPKARALALAAMCAETALAWGGQITTDGSGLRAQGKRLRDDPELWNALANQGPAPLHAATIHFSLLAQIGVAHVAWTDTQIDITL